MLLSRNAVSWDFDKDPTFWASTLPFLKSMSVGMPRMPYFLGISWFSSTLTLATLSLPEYSLATSSSTGAIALHGPHHSAQYSTRTGTSDFRTSGSKVASLTWWMNSLIASSARRGFAADAARFPCQGASRNVHGYASGIRRAGKAHAHSA